MSIRYQKQQTVSSTVEFQGVGVHSGMDVTMLIQPAKENHGIIFQRVDLEGQPLIPALYDYVIDTSLCTKIGLDQEKSVGTIEHLMAAMAALKVDNALIEINGPEVPILDGSSIVFYEKIQSIGLKEQKAHRKVIEIKKHISVALGEAYASVVPDSIFSAHVEIDFPSKVIGQQSYSSTLEDENFYKNISKARTFGFKHEVDYLRSQGLALGGSLENAIVVEGDAVLNPKGLRYSDEFVRHKLLDAIGDLYLAGGQIIGQFTGNKNGHKVNNFLLHELLSDQEAWEWALVAELSEEKQEAYTPELSLANKGLSKA